MERVTIHYAAVYNAFCEADSRTRISARTREELWTKILDGQADGLYGDVVEIWSEEAIDPDAWAAREAELRRISETTCPLPPESDLRLISEAKKVDDGDFNAIQAINPARGIFKTTRGKLREIKAEKMNAYFMQQYTP